MILRNHRRVEVAARQGHRETVAGRETESECGFSAALASGHIPIFPFFAIWPSWKLDPWYGAVSERSVMWQQERVVRTRRSRWACSRGKLVVSKAGEAYDSRVRGPNRGFRGGACSPNPNRSTIASSSHCVSAEGRKQAHDDTAHCFHCGAYAHAWGADARRTTASGAVS